MILIICGEDTATSRNYYNSLKKQYQDKGYEIRDIKKDDIEKLGLWLGESASLFNSKKIFFSERLNKQYGKTNKKFSDDLTAIAKLKDVELVVWEDVSGWELKLKKLGIVKEFKPDQTIFKLLDSVYPGNRSTFITLLGSLKQDENFIFIMLVRFIRNLLIIKSGSTPAKMQSWQTYKLKAQASQWKSANLTSFYEALFKIEVGLKTSSNPFSIKQSLEILACHFL